MQQFLKPAARTARACIVPTHFLTKLLVAVNQPLAPLNVGFAQGTPGVACSSAQKELSDSRSSDAGGSLSEAHVKWGKRLVHGDKELCEKMGRNDPCPCRSGRRFQELLHEVRAV